MAKLPNKDRATDLVSAALRHVSDAERLLTESPDQSWHLAGFAPECVRKACLSEAWLDKALGHELAEVGDRVLEVALAMDLGAARYRDRVLGLAARYPVLGEWRPDCRYEKTGTRRDAAREIVAAAVELTDELASQLWMDGRVGEVC